MKDDEGSREPFSIGALIKGLAVGMLIGSLCLALDFILGMALWPTHVRFLILNAILTVATLGIIGFFAFTKSRDTGFVRGVLVALSVAAIIATACGVGMGTLFRFN